MGSVSAHAGTAEVQIIARAKWTVLWATFNFQGSAPSVHPTESSSLQSEGVYAPKAPT